jgi:hypothetical protein
VRNELERLHRGFILAQADKACNNIVFVCKARHYNCILNEFGINSSFGNSTYTPTALLKDEILQNHRSFLDTFNIPISGMNLNYHTSTGFLNFTKIRSNIDK